MWILDEGYLLFGSRVFLTVDFAVPAHFLFEEILNGAHCAELSVQANDDCAELSVQANDDCAELSVQANDDCAELRIVVEYSGLPINFLMFSSSQ